MRQSQAWKYAERIVASLLHGKRISRGADFSVSCPDVELDDLPNLKIDVKYRKGGWSHHSLLAEIRRLYCPQSNHMPVLITKSGRERGACVTIGITDFAALLDIVRDHPKVLAEAVELRAQVSRLQSDLCALTAA